MANLIFSAPHLKEGREEIICTWGSLIVSAGNERDRQGYLSASPKNKDAKRLDLFGQKVYSTGSLQLHISKAGFAREV